MTPILQQAMAALRSGNPLEAERIAKQGLQSALDAHPKGSLVVAQARFDLATIFIAMNDYARGIEQMRHAVLLDEQTDAGASRTADFPDEPRRDPSASRAARRGRADSS